MNKEKLVLSIVAILLGLFVAGGAFYIFQMTRTIDDTSQNRPTPSIEPTLPQQENNLLIVDEPKDEQVFDKRLINIKGKTMQDATIIITTPSSDQVVTPNDNGDFTLTHTLDDGVNILNITAIFQDGTESTITRTVTSTTEEF